MRRRQKQPHMPQLCQLPVTGTGQRAGEGRKPRAGRTAAAARARPAAAAAATCAPPRGRARPRRPRCCWRRPSFPRLRGPPCTAGREARFGFWRRVSRTPLCKAGGGPGGGGRRQPDVRLGRGLAGKRCRPALRITGRQGRQCERAAQGGVCSTSAERSRNSRRECPQARYASAKSRPLPPPNLAARQAGRRPWRRRQPAAVCKAIAPRMASHMASVMPYRLRVGHSHRPWCWSAARTRRARCCGAPRPPRRCCRARAPRCRSRRRRRWRRPPAAQVLF